MKKLAAIETWTWVLIFGGLLVLSLSWFVDNSQAVLAAVLAIGGAVATSVGVLLIYLRSRMGPAKR